jgi:mRNA interferase HicA
VKKRDLVRILEQLGCVLVKNDGKHEKWRTPSGRSVSVPRHAEIAEFTARQIIREASS